MVWPSCPAQSLNGVLLNAIALFIIPPFISGVAFTEGNVVVLRSNGSTSSAQALNLIEYSQRGVQIQDIPVSSTTCTISGSTTTEGKLELSAAGSRVAWGCYDCPPGTPSVSTVRKTLPIFTHTANVNIESPTYMFHAHHVHIFRADEFIYLPTGGCIC